MFKSQKNAFWQAFLITLFIFGIGIVFGVILENWRTGKIDYLYQLSEINLIDVKLQSEIYSTGYFNCDRAIEENIKFADRIYNEAKTLERYEGASEIKEDLKLRHKKYDLLRANLLLNSMRIKQKCNFSYHEIIYFYRYNTKDMEIQAKQNVFSKLLVELKEKKGNEILLIPIACDNNLSSVNILMNIYNISEKDIPVIIIDKNKKITELETVDELINNLNK